MYHFLLFCRFLFIGAFFFLLLPLSAQTVIDLSGGDGLHAKTLRDYDRRHEAERLRADSVAYADCLTRAFNALHTDSLEAAETAFRRALKLRPHAPGNYVLRTQLARLSLATGRPQEAVAQLNEVLASRPEDVEVRSLRATALLQCARYADAASDCDVLLRDCRDSLRSRLLFIRASALMGQKLYTQARQSLDELLAAAPANENAALLYVVNLRCDGRPREAAERLDLYLSAHPGSTDALLLRAEWEMDGQHYELAAADYDAVIAKQPQVAENYVARALCRLAMKQKVAARRDLEQAVGLGLSRSALREYFEACR
ncbi:MAG: tetratricopeptide repeat protein [Alloprevotella sp.]